MVIVCSEISFMGFSKMFYFKLLHDTPLKTVSYYPTCRDRIFLSINLKNNTGQQKQNYIANLNIFSEMEDGNNRLYSNIRMNPKLIFCIIARKWKSF